MSEWKIYHNPRCSKSRETLSLLQEQGIQPIIVEYLKDGLTKKEIKQIAKQLDLSIDQFIRKKESAFADLHLDGADEETLLNALIKNPILLERPIVLRGDNAGVIGRPPENALKLTH